jgi:predicted TIM-barrel fold metal-dependent hydrolase
VDGSEFIMDCQTHWFKGEDLARNPGFYNLFRFIIDRATEANYINDIFMNSDTDVTVLTAWPGTTCTPEATTCGLPLSNESIVASRDKINQAAANTRRVINHVQLNLPADDSGLSVQSELDVMDAMCESGVGGWKLYPGFHRWKLDQPNARSVIEKGLAKRVKIFCVHKGLQIGGFFDPIYNYPNDVGIVAAAYPDANFVIYHSGICSLSPTLRDQGYNDCVSPYTDEGPYDPSDPNPNGVNALIRSLADNGVGPNANVYAEIGSAINHVQNDAVQTAHFFGKLMKYVGVDRVVWGTDCIIYGSPQGFIQWFRAATIPEAMQAEFGYPPLDATNKAKIFGLNAANLYGIDPTANRCAVQQTAYYKMKQQLDNELGPNRWVFETPKGPKTRAEFAQHVKRCKARGEPG